MKIKKQGGRYHIRSVHQISEKAYIQAQKNQLVDSDSESLSDLTGIRKARSSSAGSSKENISDRDNNVKYRSDEALKEAVGKEQSRIQAAVEWAKEWIFAMKQKDVNGKPDINFFNTLFGSISYYCKRVPALSRVFDAAMKLRDNKHRLENYIFNSLNGDGKSELEPVITFSKKHRREWRTLEKDYLWHRDLNAVGYKVKKSRNGKTFRVVNPDGVAVEEFSREEPAWEFAWEAEANDMKKSGKWSNEACNIVHKLRRILGRQYQMLLDGVEQQQKECEALGVEMPMIDGINIFDELRRMGDRRGYYMPRLRHGNHMLWAHKSGENPRLETFDTKLQRAARAATLKRQGYSIDMSLSNRPSEDAFAGSDILAMNDLINNAMERVRQNENLSFEQFGLSGNWIDYELKNGETERHFVISGSDTKAHRNLFKEFGGNYYDDCWHFKHRKSSFEKTILNAVGYVEGTRIVQVEAVGRALSEQIAAIIHSHGSRSRKIKRDGRTGKDVYLGFEEDILRAATMAGRAVAGGTAKRIMAKDMLEAFTGKDLKWKDYKLANMPHNVEYGSPEYYQAVSSTWNDYEQAVKKRSVDSSKQKNAYKEGISFMGEMLRNEEPSERVFGFVKGVAAFKYLSGISSGLVNLTALATSVPAAMKTFGNIPMKRHAILLAKASNRYTRYMMYHKFGKGKKLMQNDEWLYDEITKRGWDSDLQNQEAIGVTQTWGSKVWREVVDKSLIVFSLTERLNRASTIAAAYEGLVEQHKGDISPALKEQFLLKAKEISDKAHGVYGKENLPSWARGSSAGAQMARSFYMYKTFTHNYLQLMSEILFKEKNPVAFAWMAVAPAIIAGHPANVLAPVISAFVKLIPGFDVPDDPEEAFYQWVGQTFGKKPERFARSGLAGLLGLNLKGSMAIGTPEIPMTVPELLGAPYSLGEGIVTGATDLLHGDWLKGAEKLSPRFLSGGFKAYREHSEGITTKSNQPLYWGNERLKADYYDTLLRSVGFNPAGISEKREIQWSERKIEMKYSDMRKGIYARVRRFLLTGGSTARWAKILKEIEEYNARVLRQEHKSVPLITSRTLKGIHTRINRPFRRERLRAAAGSDKRESEDLSNFKFTGLRNGGITRRLRRTMTRRLYSAKKR